LEEDDPSYSPKQWPCVIEKFVEKVLQNTAMNCEDRFHDIDLDETLLSLEECLNAIDCVHNQRPGRDVLLKPANTAEPKPPGVLWCLDFFVPNIKHKGTSGILSKLFKPRTSLVFCGVLSPRKFFMS
jgi:hypothetical protein